MGIQSYTTPGRTRIFLCRWPSASPFPSWFFLLQTPLRSVSCDLRRDNVKWKKIVVVREIELLVDKQCSSKIIRQDWAGRRNRGRTFDVRNKNVILAHEKSYNGTSESGPPAPWRWVLLPVLIFIQTISISNPLFYLQEYSLRGDSGKWYPNAHSGHSGWSLPTSCPLKRWGHMMQDGHQMPRNQRWGAVRPIHVDGVPQGRWHLLVWLEASAGPWTGCFYSLHQMVPDFGAWFSSLCDKFLN